MGSLVRNQNICRFCASDIGSGQEYYGIYTDSLPSQQFDKQTVNLSFSAAAAQYLKIKLDIDSAYPRISCVDCADVLQKLVIFYRKLEIGQSKLNEILISEGSLEIRKRGRPKKGFEKKSKESVIAESVIERQVKRKIKLPKRFEESKLEAPIIEDDDLKDSALRIDESNTSAGENQEVRNKTAMDEINSILTQFNEKEAKNSDIFMCEACNKRFTYQEELDDHFDQCHGHIMYKCDTKQCQAIIKTKSELKAHQSTLGHEDFIILEIGSANKTNFKLNCDQCEESFSTLEGLQNHIEEAHKGVESKLFQCEEVDCNRFFGSASSLAYHKISAHKNESFTCTEPGCDKVFKLKNLLHRHLKTHNSERLYNCDQCSKSFKTKSNLQSHRVVHNEESKYFCEECGQQFKHRTSLATHIRLHSKGNKSFKCPFCPKSFNQKGNLQEHIRIHTGEKPFKCDICLKTFTTSSQHRLHVRRHLGVKQYKCEICTKSFFNKDTLKTHLRRHRGERPFSCQLCKKAFAEAWALTKHMRFHSGQQPYLCKECGKKFADSSNLAKHRKTHEEAGDKKNKPTVWNLVKEAGEEIQEATETDVEVTDDVDQVIYITYENGETKAGELQTIDGQNVKFVEISEGQPIQDGQQINLTTKDGTQYRIVAPFADESLTFATDYIKDLQN